MTRDEFSAEFARGLRFVLQKHEREVAARASYYSAPARCIASAEQSLTHATTMTDAAVQQFADHIFDAIESRSAVPA